MSEFLGPLLGLFGGIMDHGARARDAKANTPKALRAALEEAGYNPLLMPNIAGTQGAGYAPQMGSNMNALASTLAFSDSEQNALRLRATEIEQENEFLQRQLQRQTLTPDVPGIYPTTETDGPTGGPSPAIAPRLAALTPDFDQERQPSGVGSGLIALQNAMTGGEVILPGADGEPWGIDELATAAILGPPQVAYNWVAQLYQMEGSYGDEWEDWFKSTKERGKGGGDKDSRKEQSVNQYQTMHDVPHWFGPDLVAPTW